MRDIQEGNRNKDPHSSASDGYLDRSAGASGWRLALTLLAGGLLLAAAFTFSLSARAPCHTPPPADPVGSDWVIPAGDVTSISGLDKDMNGHNIVVRGTLNLDGCNIYNMGPADSGNFRDPSSNSGIDYRPGSSGSIYSSTITNTNGKCVNIRESGITVGGPGQGNDIDSPNDTPAVYVDKNVAGALIQYNDITSDGRGGYADDGSSPTYRYNSIKGDYGIFARLWANPDIHHNDIYDSTYGIYLYGTHAQVHHNHFYDTAPVQTGYGIYSWISDPHIYENTFDDYGFFGIDFYTHGGAIAMVGNVAGWAGYPVGTTVIEDNTFNGGGGSAIEGYASAPEVRRNTINAEGDKSTLFAGGIWARGGGFAWTIEETTVNGVSGMSGILSASGSYGDTTLLCDDLTITGCTYGIRFFDIGPQYLSISNSYLENRDCDLHTDGIAVYAPGTTEPPIVTDTQYYKTCIPGLWNAPSPFGLSGPQDGSALSVLRPVLTWEESTNPDGGDVAYELWYSNDPDFATCQKVTDITDTHYAFPTDLDSDRDYYWKVRSFNERGLYRWCDPSRFEFHTPGEPEFEVVKRAESRDPSPGSIISYTISIENSGTWIAEDVWLTDEIPEGTSIVEGSVTCSDDQATVDDGNPLKITDITVGEGETVTVTFDVRIDSDIQPGTVIPNQGLVNHEGAVTASSNPDEPGQGTPTEIVVEQYGKKLGSTGWLIAEGSTGGGFDTWILLMNPGGSVADVEVTFATQEGPAEPLAFSIEPKSRTTVRINDWVPDEFSVSAMVESSVPIVAERSTYWNKNEAHERHPYGLAPYEMMSGHANLGVPAEALSGRNAAGNGRNACYFPEGATAGGFDTWILLLNPNPRVANARVNLMTADGTWNEEELTIGPMCRATVHLDELLPASYEVSTEVTSDAPLVAERSTYWDPGAASKAPYEMMGGHSNSACTGSATEWYLAEGATASGFETYVLIQNPGHTEATAAVDFFDDNGDSIRESIVMQPRSRASLKMSDYAPDNFQVSTRVTSDVPIVAERSTYWNKDCSSEAYSMLDGHSCVGTSATSDTWVITEGATGGGFDSFVLIINTEDSRADVRVTLMTQHGPYEPFTVEMEPNSRFTLRLRDLLPDEFQVSTIVESENQLVVERTTYWDSRRTSPEGDFPVRPFETMGGHSATGYHP